MNKNQENYNALKELIKERCLSTDDLIDTMGNEAISECLEFFQTYCNCGQPFAELEDETGFCGGCR